MTSFANDAVVRRTREETDGACVWEVGVMRTRVRGGDGAGGGAGPAAAATDRKETALRRTDDERRNRPPRDWPGPYPEHDVTEAHVRVQERLGCDGGDGHFRGARLHGGQSHLPH